MLASHQGGYWEAPSGERKTEGTSERADGHVERDGIVHVVQPDYTHLSLNSPSRESDIERPHDKS